MGDSDTDQPLGVVIAMIGDFSMTTEIYTTVKSQIVTVKEIKL